mmetsp:Transcript_44492/g.65187  ORF Transcript_44492/g.65187 Transcript_44492/m.65187 type:complete len:235 (-) Transcript_44492:25-729(-)
MCVCDGFKPFISSPSPPAACAAACACAACACAACAAALFRRRPPPAPDRLLGGLPARPGPAPAVAPCEAVGSPVVCIGRLLAAEAIGWSASPGVSSPAHVRLSGESGMSKSFRPEAGSEWPTSPRPPVFSRTASVSKPSPKRSFKNIDSESAFSMPSSIFECCTCAFLGARSPCPCAAASAAPHFTHEFAPLSYTAEGAASVAGSTASLDTNFRLSVRAALRQSMLVGGALPAY